MVVKLILHFAEYESMAAVGLQKKAAKAARKDRLKLSERGGEVFGVIAMTLFTSFFVYHQITQTGFFTSAFGLREMILFYAPLPTGISANVLRAVAGRRNIARPVDVINSITFATAAFWFFSIFPFDFSHFGDALPFSLGFLPKGVIRIIFLLVGFIGVGLTIYTSILYFSTRKELERIGTAYYGRHFSTAHSNQGSELMGNVVITVEDNKT